MRVAGAKVWVRLLVGACLVLAAAASLPAQDYTRDSRPELFSYDELVQLGASPETSPELTGKLHALITTPFVNSEAYLDGSRPRPLNVPGLGPTLRVALWNIERGLELDYIQMFLTDKDGFMAEVAEQRKRPRKAERGSGRSIWRTYRRRSRY